jgi:glycosyltransferase involved in cell wall biosynthesis
VSRPFFSVIIPTYNRSDKLRRALESLLSQTMGDFEVLVCDDGSTDGTEGVVSAYGEKLRVTYLWEENWGGPARPRNRGITAARGEWLCFLDADDWWYPEKLAEVLPFTGEADLIYHDCEVYTNQGRRGVGKRSRQFKEPVFAELMTRGCSLVTSSVCVKKEILEKSGGFAEERELVAIEDYDLWLRIALITEKFHYLPRSLGAYWIDQANISEFSEKYIAREAAVLRRYTGHLSRSDRAEAEKLLAYKIGVAKKYLGNFAESRSFFREAMRSRRPKIRLYSMAYYVLALLRSRYTIP